MFGIFPFQNASQDDEFFNLIIDGDIDTYWKAVGLKNKSPLLQDLLIKMLDPVPEKRPTAHEVEQHPWMKEGSYSLPSLNSFDKKPFVRIHTTSLGANSTSTTCTDKDCQLQSSHDKLQEINEKFQAKIDP